MGKHQRIAAVAFGLMLSPLAMSQASAKQTVEVAFVLDTTGSTGDGDLVADYAASRARLDQIKEDELPPTLRELPKPERSAALEQQSNERKELNAKLADLVARRDACIVAQRSKQRPKTSSFDQAVAATLKAQIK